MYAHDFQWGAAPSDFIGSETAEKPGQMQDAKWPIQVHYACVPSSIYSLVDTSPNAQYVF